MEVDKENRKNILNRRPLKAAVPLSKPVPTRRPALGELGNRIVHQEKTETIKTKITVTKVETVQIVKNTNFTTLESQAKKIVTKPLIRPKLTTKKNETTTTLTEESSYSTMQLAGLVDPDLNDKGDVCLVAEYVQDIFNYLRELEMKYNIHKGYLNSHQTTPTMRRVLVNWMIDVNGNFQFLQETLHLSIAILDCYLQCNKTIGRSMLQLVGITSMMIACKYEEVLFPDFEDFLYVCDNFFTKSQLLEMERQILMKLEFTVGRPLSLHFLRRYHKIAHVRPQEHNLAKYLLEIFLFEYELCHICPSMQAAVASCLSLSILNDVLDPAKVWTKVLVYHTTYKYSDIKPIMLHLVYFLVKLETSRYKAIRNKYAKVNVGKISCHPKLNGPVVQKLLQEARLLRNSLTNSN